MGSRIPHTVTATPSAGQACELTPSMGNTFFAAHVRAYAEDGSFGDPYFDSVEQLMQAIEASIAAKRPKPLTEAVVHAMRWTAGTGGTVGPLGVTAFWAQDRRNGDLAADYHNADIDRLWAECERWRAIAAGCGCVVGCTTPESLQCRTHGMAAEYRVDAMERCIAAAQNQIDLLAKVGRLEAALARKQRCIDAALQDYECDRGVHSMVSVLRPEATPTPVDNAVTDRATPVVSQADELPSIGEQYRYQYIPVPESKEQPPLVVPPIGQHHPDDPLVTEWEGAGFRIVKQEGIPIEFTETHGSVQIGSEISPSWLPTFESLWLRGVDREKHDAFVAVPSSDRSRVWAAICSLNAKHRKPQPEPMTVKAGCVGLGVDGVRDSCRPQPAQPEPSGDRAVRLVKRLSKALHLDAVWHRLSDNTKVELEAILRECDGGAK